MATNPPPLWAKSVADNPQLAALLKSEMTPEEVERFRQQGRWMSIGCGTAYTRLGYRYVFSPYRPRIWISFHYWDSKLHSFDGPDFLYTREGDLFVAHSIPNYWNRRPEDCYEPIR